MISTAFLCSTSCSDIGQDTSHRNIQQKHQSTASQCDLFRSQYPTDTDVNVGEGQQQPGVLQQARSQHGWRQPTTSTSPHTQRLLKDTSGSRASAAPQQERGSSSAQPLKRRQRWVFVRCERGNYYCFLTCLWALVTYTP